MLKKSIIIICLVLNGTCHPAVAQKIFYPGYVVTNQGDTLKGKIPYDISTNNNYHIVDLKDSNGFIKKFNVWQIKMYCMNNEFYYTKTTKKGEMKHRNDLVFMHLLKIGKLKLYEYEYITKMGSAREFEAGGFTTEGEKDFYAEKSNKELIYFSRLEYKLTLKELLADDEELLLSTEFKDAKYKNIPEMVALYNSHVK